MNKLVTLKENKTLTLGFWIYIMTDLVLFAALFATYAVLHSHTNGGPMASELFKLPVVLLETVILLTSSFFAGLAYLSAKQQQASQAFMWLFITGLLGLSFLALEINEFVQLANEGLTVTTSAFGSAFFTLVGTHGLHITAGLIWLSAILVYLYKRGLNDKIFNRILLFTIICHFIDIVWFFIFSFVYLMGVIS